eukprot:s5649_g3.t2
MPNEPLARHEIGFGCREVEVLFRLTSGGMPTSSPNSALNFKPKCNDLAGRSESAGSDSLLRRRKALAIEVLRGFQRHLHLLETTEAAQLLNIVDDRIAEVISSDFSFAQSVSLFRELPDDFPSAAVDIMPDPVTPPLAPSEAAIPDPVTPPLAPSDAAPSEPSVERSRFWTFTLVTRDFLRQIGEQCPDHLRLDPIVVSYSGVERGRQTRATMGRELPGVPVVITTGAVGKHGKGVALADLACKRSADCVCHIDDRWISSRTYSDLDALVFICDQTSEFEEEEDEQDDEGEEEEGGDDGGDDPNGDDPVVEPRIDDGFDARPQASNDGEDFEAATYKCKDLKDLKMPQVPKDSVGFRLWRNALLTQYSAIDRTGKARILRWLQVCMGPEVTNREIAQLQNDPEQLPQLDSFLASQISDAKYMKGEFGLEVQAYIERAHAHGVLPCYGYPANFASRDVGRILIQSDADL